MGGGTLIETRPTAQRPLQCGDGAAYDAPMTSPVTLDSIRFARERIRDKIYHSPCPHSFNLSRLCSAQIYCKLDHLQTTGSFKERGARNKLKLLLETTEPGTRAIPGVVAASAGNHALGLAY